MSSPQRIVALDLQVVDPMPESIEKCLWLSGKTWNVPVAMRLIHDEHTC